MYGTAYMALDFVKGKDMLDVIEEGHRALPPYEVKRILLKVLDAITYIHANDVLHRDISPDNILLAAGNEPVLIDFGAAREEATRKTPRALRHSRGQGRLQPQRVLPRGQPAERLIRSLFAGRHVPPRESPATRRPIPRRVSPQSPRAGRTPTSRFRSASTATTSIS